MLEFLTSDRRYSAFFASEHQNGFFDRIKHILPPHYSPEDVFDISVFKENPSLFYSCIQSLSLSESAIF